MVLNLLLRFGVEGVFRKQWPVGTDAFVRRVDASLLRLIVFFVVLHINRRGLLSLCSRVSGDCFRNLPWAP